MSEARKNSGVSRTALLVVAVIVGVALVAVASSLIILKPWQSHEYKECVATLEQLNGGEDVPDPVVDTECSPYK